MIVNESFSNLPCSMPVGSHFHGPQNNHGQLSRAQEISCGPTFIHRHLCIHVFINKDNVKICFWVEASTLKCLQAAFKNVAPANIYLVAGWTQTEVHPTDQFGQNGLQINSGNSKKIKVLSFLLIETLFQLGMSSIYSSCNCCFYFSFQF